MRARVAEELHELVDMFGLSMADFVPQVDEILSVGEFYERSADGQIIFT